MDNNFITFIGFAAGAITSIGFIPQLIRGYRTKKLDDVSYWMPTVLTVGMTLWFFYGVLRSDITIIAANMFGAGCSILLIILKKLYSTN
jgi:MtN3 and saliva related transmembrane protein